MATAPPLPGDPRATDLMDVDSPPSASARPVRKSISLPTSSTAHTKAAIFPMQLTDFKTLASRSRPVHKTHDKSTITDPTPTLPFASSSTTTPPTPTLKIVVPTTTTNTTPSTLTFSQIDTYARTHFHTAYIPLTLLPYTTESKYLWHGLNDFRLHAGVRIGVCADPKNAFAQNDRQLWAFILQGALVFFCTRNVFESSAIFGLGRTECLVAGPSEEYRRLEVWPFRAFDCWEKNPEAGRGGWKRDGKEAVERMMARWDAERELAVFVKWVLLGCGAVQEVEVSEGFFEDFRRACERIGREKMVREKMVREKMVREKMVREKTMMMEKVALMRDPRGGVFRG